MSKNNFGRIETEWKPSRFSEKKEKKTAFSKDFFSFKQKNVEANHGCHSKTQVDLEDKGSIIPTLWRKK